MKIGNGYEGHNLPPNGDGQKTLFPIEVVTLDNIQCPEDSSLLQCDLCVMGEWFSTF